MLNVRDANEEFEMKTGCLRRKSLDFNMDKERAAKNSGSGHKHRNINNLIEDGEEA